MEDFEIVNLYWDRNPEAVARSSEKYGNYCFSVAENLLANAQDSEECVNDTLLKAWDSMPPHRPVRLKLYLAKITRALAFNRWHSRTAQKRGGGELPLVLEELEECIAGGTDPEEQVESAELSENIRRFVKSLPAREKNVFVSRYFFTESVEQTAKDSGLTVNHTYVMLSRIRKKLRRYLVKEELVYEERRSL